ncbi:MAG TPA: zinc ribbon domain-containing protein [Thermoanaerobaculia bacterium]|nr:zinc ribbon domain-containing protein [Thermoanaerobaculia bacterium]
MPIYEYRCRECEGRFERFVSGESRVACPECESRRVERLLSVFAVANGSSKPAAPAGGACGSCGDPRGPGACSID